MNEDRKRILGLLAERKITADEADRLLSALDRSVVSPGLARPAANGKPRWLRVEVDADRPERGPTKVNIRVPMNLLRAGVRLSALMPPSAREEVNAAMARRGVAFDIDQLKPENIEALIEQLGDLTLDVKNERAKVRIYFE